MNRKTWTSNFRLTRQGERNWLLTSAAGPAADASADKLADTLAIDILLLDTPLDTPATDLGFDRVNIEWLPHAAAVELYNGDAVFRTTAAGVLVHESRPALYRALPLAQFDARARGFWKRIFLLVRLPGGRALLRLLARRTRA